MRKRFFLGLAVVVALIWGPLWLWNYVEAGSTLSMILRIVLIAGVALGGYLLWHIVVHSLIGPGDD